MLKLFQAGQARLVIHLLPRPVQKTSVAEPKAVKAPEPVVGMDRGCWFNFEGHIWIPWTFKGN